MAELLSAFEDAVRLTAFWREHGTHGDGRLAEAEANEARIRAQLALKLAEK